MNDAPKNASIGTLEFNDASEVAIRRLADFPNGQSNAGEKADVAILEAMQGDGSVVLFAENDIWTVLWVLLYWDVVFAELPGSYDPRVGPSFPQRGQDIPADLFRDSFFQTHRALYEARRAELESADLIKELARGRRRSRAAWTRLLEDADRFSPEEIEATLRSFPTSAILQVLDRLWQDYKEHRRGLPDLMVLGSTPSLIEVKGPKDRLAPVQADWLRYLSDECGIRCEVLVVGWSDRRVASLRKKLSPEQPPSVASTSADASQPHAVALHACTTTETLDAQISLQRAVASVPADTFWADHIKTLRASPMARLACALEYRPLPGAYTEAAVALRALIREKRKSSGDWSAELSKLYSLAAESGFLLDTPYIEGIGPGYNVACTISDETRRSLAFPYADLGYEEMSLLNKTDRKWVVEAWGEPDRHQEPQHLHQSVWDGAVSKCLDARKRRDEEFRRDINALRAGTAGPESRSVGIAGSLLALVILTAVVALLLR
jgi:hypothetical protein